MPYKVSLPAVAALSLLAGSAAAGTIPYPNIYTQNPVTYTFTAASTGQINAYFTGSTAGYDEKVGMLVNGVSTGITGLDNQSSAIGAVLDMGAVTAGDTLTFVDYISTTGDTWYSDKALNTDGTNHVYSTSVTAGQAYVGSPSGTYVGFEDLPGYAADFNYVDDPFIFDNTATVAAGGVPEPISWTLMLVGLAGIGGALRRTRRGGTSIAA